MLQCVAVCCSESQCVYGKADYDRHTSVVFMCYSMLQRVAVCCSVSQCVAVCCSELQCVAVSCI